MKIGAFTIEQLSEGQFEVFNDGHINRVSTDDRNQEDSTDFFHTPASSSIVGINPILINSGKQHIIIDPGLGWGLDAGSDYTSVSNIRTNLQIFELTPEDITHVILTHLHYDHAAGCSFTNEHSEIKPTFPQATYYLHQKEWDYALQKQEGEQTTKGAGYHLDDFYRLVADSNVAFINENIYEVFSGITLLWTGGHTPGHQVVRIGQGKEYAYYLGDLLPSEYHLNHYGLHQMDVHPIQAKKKKIQLLKQAYQEEAVLLFYHSKFTHSGRLAKNKDKRYTLVDVEK